MSKATWTMLGSITGIGIFMIISYIFFLKGKGASFMAKCNNISEEDARNRCRSSGKDMIAFSLWLLLTHAAGLYFKAMWPIFCGMAVMMLLCIVDIVRYVQNKKFWFFGKFQ